MKQFNTTKEELHKLGLEFKFQAFNLIDELFNLAFWLVLKKRSAKKIIWVTYIKAIYYCDKTKADTNWPTWMHRIFFNRIIDHYNKHSEVNNFNFQLIDLWKADPELIPRISYNNSNQISEKKLIVLLNNIPQTLILPLILKDIYNLSYQSIAEFLDMPYGVIASRIYRARKFIFIKLLNQSFDVIRSKDEHKDLIFKLRVTSELLDNEFPDARKIKMEEKLKADPLIKTEFEMQEKIKTMLSNSIIRKYPPSGLNRKIKKEAENRFSVKI
jgi:DNA-directed RNA polymerase specialized sigma24 family protein